MIAHLCFVFSVLVTSFTFGNTANATANLLTNASFETPDASAGDVGPDFPCGDKTGTLGGWNYFNCNYVSSNLFMPGDEFKNPTAHTGNQVLKQFGIDAGYFQDAAANPGDDIEASLYAMKWNGDYFKNIFLLQIFALDSSVNNISGCFSPLAQVTAGSDVIGGIFDYELEGTDVGNEYEWTLMVVSAVAPAGTASTRIQLIHILISGTPNSGAIFLDDASLTVTPATTPIEIDIKPDSDINSLNVGSSGVIPVAILSTPDFDALNVDPTSVSLAGASVKLVGKSDKYLCHQEDVNLDGMMDLVCQVYTAQFMVDEGETTAILEAETFDGAKLRGEDYIRIVPDN